MNFSQDSSMLGAEVDYLIQTTQQTEPKDSLSPQACSESATESVVEVRPTWLAGFIDGEGNFQISRDKRSGRYYPRLSVTNTDYYTLECIKLTFGGSISRHSSFSKKNPKWKPSYRWTISGEAAEALARKLKPFILTKRKTVKLFIDFCAYRDQRDPNLITLSRYRQRMKALNRRGI